MDGDSIPRALSNAWQDCQLLNFGVNSGGKGPYAVRQAGYPPNSEVFRNQVHVLTREGVWLLMLRWAGMPEDELRCIAFESVAEVYEMFERLAGKGVESISTLPEGVTEEQAVKDMERTGQRIIQWIRDAKPVEWGR